ncbi:Na(+)-translocating NADH-quinone reductase subunit A [Sphingobacteriales bacterium UPWRP_1]|nr:NADH:ubiquinone reductase (Na(+)-transporting) subunit A [Sphingobacteriales bacterium TSM_CSM]PSJ72320.1 Na(+)-translocating NADH-quinone reductase subunit A [Sphingobacteriales bacterium UPWRP_1]
MANIKLKRGFDIKIKGAPQKETAQLKSRTFAVNPADFNGISPIPKLLVNVGDEVKAGTPLFFDKKNPDVIYASPVSGEIAEIKRGAKRAVEEVVILADDKMEFVPLERIRISSASREEVVKHLLTTGCWPFFRQRPFNIIASHTDVPKNIFISGFDSAPMAPDYNYVMEGQKEAFQAGIEVLRKLTTGKVHLSVDGRTTPSKTFTEAKGVELHTVSGPHPAGCVGVQIHHIAPINKGDIVWTINPQDVVAIGRVFNDGQFNTERLVAVGGPCVKQPQYYKTYLGASVDSLVAGNLSHDHVRLISGNVLTGKKVSQSEHLGFYHQQLSAIEEGDKYEFFGWLLPSYPRPSLSRTFTGFLNPGKEYNVNTNTHGEHRAMVVTGAYEDVTPMDILPMQLLKAVLCKDLDLMEGLGIYEVVEEDLALCEFVCPSKTEVQHILREGLTLMHEQS